MYLEAAGHVVVGWIWLEQFLATGDGDDVLRQGKRQACRYFYRYELPCTAVQFDLLARLDTTTLGTDDTWF
ncbi:acyl-CoA dehydrogenase C-terminal domain-containing protein [Streptomyces hyaluromycini]|uniref:Acyl-CoA dehydrogenase C-terminal domain-containing protein n=1 Tax=Streptomyces hyaluromycini TaxID=1377993 RepID=A0ABV1WV71_9ACTN